MFAAQTSALDIATAVVALYAAIVASVALAFQVFSSLRGWQTRVEVDVRRMEMIEPGSKPEPAVVFRLINHSGHPVKVTNVSLAPLKKGGHHVWISQPFPLLVPGTFEIPARDSFSGWIRPEVIVDYDPHWKTRALIATSDGGRFESKKVRVQDLVTDTPAK
jgi:hypothetical protein